MENQNKIYLFWKFKLENQHSKFKMTNIPQGFGKPTFYEDENQHSTRILLNMRNSYKDELYVTFLYC